MILTFARIAELLDLVATLAKMNPIQSHFDFKLGEHRGYYCYFCEERYDGDEDFHHAPGCLWLRAHNITAN